ncbi:hypothetical protein F4778DRAFT_243725 [Xylariomycetidae sp. FL2044]|nr:hypothetical protein F4778DRAFT_243725 [Xylariomycetidae sp. FL2044]
MNPQPPRPPGSPAPSQDNTHVMAKFFGVGEAKGKNVPSQAVKDNKEKNAASRLLNAFRRVPKQPDSNQTTQQRPASGQPVARPGAPGQPGQGRGQMPQAGRGQMPAQVHIMQGGRGQMPPQMPMMQGGRGQMPPSIMQGGRGQAPPGQMHPGQVLQGPMPPQMQIMQGGRGQMPPQLQTIQGGRGQVPSQMQAGRGHIPPGQVPTGQMPSHPQALMPGQRPPVGPGKGEPQYDHVPIPRGYQAVHGYGPGVMLAPSPYDIGRPSPPPATQYPPHPFQGMMPTPGPQQQQWDPRMALPPHGMVPYGQPQPQQHGQPGFMQQPAQKPPQQSPQHSEPQQQPIMRQIPPNQIPISSTAQQNYSQYPANVAIQPVSQPSQEHIQSLPPQQPQSQDQFNSQHPQSVDSQTPSTSNWGSAPANTHNPQSQRRVNSHSQPSPVPENPAEDAGSIPAGSQKFQPQHIASAMNNEDAYSRPPQSDPSGGNQVAAQPPLKRLPEVPSPSGSQSKEPTQATSQESLNIPSQRDGAVSPEVGRLTSRMSQIHEPPRKTSLSPEIVDERAMSVSPEPPLTRRPAPGPSHKVSEPSLDVNAERANTQMKDPDEDLYDVTPRMNHHAHMPHHGHENIKYAGSEKGRAIPNGAGGLGTAAAAAAGGAIIGAGASTDATAAASSTTTSSTADEYDAEFGHPTPPVQQVRKQPTIQFNDEPEEKILIEDPVELPAVNDDDDGIPMMSATSYPGQEWNPYGAGEFGDWD